MGEYYIVHWDYNGRSGNFGVQPAEEANKYLPLCAGDGHFWLEKCEPDAIADKVPEVVTDDLGQFSDEDECLDAWSETVECDTDLMMEIMRLSNLELKRRNGLASDQDKETQDVLTKSVLKQCADALEYARSPDFK